MNFDDYFDFGEENAPESVLGELTFGQTISGAELLTRTDALSDEALEEIFESFAEDGITIDLSDLPRNAGSGEAVRRLREEEQLVRDGKLLTGLEENDPLRLYLQELASIPVCGDTEVLALELLEGKDVREKLVNLSLSRVVELAMAHTGRGVLLMDLIQEGSLGLWDAILNFAGGSFEHCRDLGITQAMARAVLRQARASGLGQKMRQAVEDYRMVDERLLSELGRNPTLDEIAESMHMTVSEIETVRKLLDNARLVGKAHEVKEPEEETPEDTQAVEDTAYYQTRERVDSLMSGISELEQKVVTMRYGLEGKAPQTAQEVGRKLNLTVSEVVELETAALNKMRKSGE
ncbi:MAG: sigma-70 family RNA polymerase sigma factor [Oscillospiraceae bacterium]|nr:sigma-70 family RNA polymerase sigma factor [Oscillospiraceae bacterium]